MANTEDTEHTDLCTRVHDLLTEATELRLWPLADALRRAEDAAHVLCPADVTNCQG
jgi:hypothetical protein